MINRKLIAGILFSTLFVATVFLAVCFKRHVILFSLFGLLFSVFAIMSILHRTPDADVPVDCYYKKSILRAIGVLSITLLFVFCVFLILYLLGKESLDWYISVLGIIANASLLFYCLLVYKKY